MFRDPATGVCAARIFPDDGELLDDGVRTTWTTAIGGRKTRVVSTIRLAGDFEFRRHVVAFDPADLAKPGAAPRLAIEALEGSYPLGLLEGEAVERRDGSRWTSIRSTRSGHLLVAWKVAGHETIGVAHDFDPKKRSRVNLVSPRMAVLSLSRKLDLSGGTTITLTSLHYASPKPAGMEQIQAEAKKLIRQWR